MNNESRSTLEHANYFRLQTVWRCQKVLRVKLQQRKHGFTCYLSYGTSLLQRIRRPINHLSISFHSPMPWFALKITMFYFKTIAFSTIASQKSANIAIVFPEILRIRDSIRNMNPVIQSSKGSWRSVIADRKLQARRIGNILLTCTLHALLLFMTCLVNFNLILISAINR